MEKQKILELLKEFKKNNTNPYIYAYKRNYKNELPKDDPSNDAFEGFRSDSWRVGGLTGGNCWGDAADRSVSADDPEEITLLEKFLEDFMPNITHLHLRSWKGLSNMTNFPPMSIMAIIPITRLHI